MTSQSDLEALVAKRMTGVSVTGRSTGRERGRSLASYYRHDPGGNVLGRRFPAAEQPGDERIPPLEGDRTRDIEMEEP